MIKEQVQQSTERAHRTLAHGEQQRQRCVTHAQDIARLADAKEEELLASLPALRSRLEAAERNPKASEDEQAALKRDYLTCVQNLHRVRQVSALAHRQQIVAGHDPMEAQRPRATIPD